VEALEAAERGIDVVATSTGVQRRAYRSLLDQELRPYSVRAPQGHRPGASQPLLVYLHGSGEDDREQLSRPWLPEGFVLLAPGGRGPSTWYWSDHAQDDIREATDDVMATYGVDPARVVLAGFSMGGYGVYLTARESPRRFRALAVFSGTPRPRDSAIGGAPDFLLESDLSAFARLPIFVFHGGKDRNCPIGDTRALVDRLRLAGADVTFVVEEDKGHEAPGADTLRAFSDWLARVAGAKQPGSAAAASY
jgi:dipeptidyl aminopeptidase/acylaminoacyl peptidase